MIPFVVKSFSLAYQAALSLYVDTLTSRRPFSTTARASVRNSYFHSRCRIPSVTLAEFCAQLGSTQPKAVTLPAFSTEGNDGIGAPEFSLSLASISATLQPRQIVEFGTFLGLSSLILAINAPDAQVLTIDLPDETGAQTHLDQTDQRHVRVSRNRVGNWFKNTPQESRIHELKGDSREIKLREHIESAELVLVDGGHDIQCITADTDNALAVTRSGGVILWDDYFWMYPDVVRFLDHLAKSRKMVRIQGTNLVAHIRN